MKRFPIWLLMPMIGMFTGCSTFGPAGGGTYRDSSYGNPNPAPKALTPPDYTKKDAAPVLDSAYLSSQADYHFTMGESLSYEGQSWKAIEEFKTTLIYDPKSVHVHLRLAAEYVRMSMITEAVEQGEMAVEMAPQNVEARMLLGGLYAGLKMYDQANAQFEQILQDNPGHSEASIYLGALLAEQKKYDESIHYFTQLTKDKNFKETEKAYYYIGRVRSEQGPEYYSASEKAFQKALAMKPEYPEATVALAMLYRAQEKEDQMERLLKSYQDKFGPEHEMSRQLAHLYLEREDFDKALEELELVDSFERDNLNVKIQIALILIEQKKYEIAATKLEDVLQQVPDSDKVRYYLGAVYEEINHPELAIVHYGKIVANSPYFGEAIVHRAHLTKQAGKLDKAIEIVEKGLQQQDDLPQLYAYYATLLDEKKSYKKAVQMLDGAVTKFPNNTQLRFFLGTMQDRLGNTAETISQMNKVIEQDKDHVQALNYLAYTYAEMGSNLDAAATMATHALELQPNDGYILDTLGWVHFKKGEVDEAIRYLEAAQKIKNDEAIIAEHLGDAYLRHQMWQKAQRMYQRAMELEHDVDHNRKIKEKLANLRLQSQDPERRPASVVSPN